MTDSPRIKRIQEAHPWMLEREARAILITFYYTLNYMSDEDDTIEGLQQEMEEMVDRLCEDTRSNIEKLLNTIPERLLQEA